MAFQGYLVALSELERAFRSAGVNIEFRMRFPGGQNRLVEILRDGKSVCAKSIEGDSPAQAIRDVAEAVRL
jgi:hypothetical protein